MAESQRRTDEHLQELATEVRELAAAQQRTERRLDGLSEAVGGLQRAFGATIEDEAESFILALLQEKGYRLLAEPRSLPLAVCRRKHFQWSRMPHIGSGDPSSPQYMDSLGPLTRFSDKLLDGEVDVVMSLEAPTGENVWAVVEAKARLGYREVREWGQRMRSSGWHERLAARGVASPYLVYAYGIRVDPGAVAAAQEQGIGLVTGRGEQVAPEGLIRQPAAD